MIKKAAMFGLDARIALAIFGALSVISGAVLYSAIQNANATSLLHDLREVGKAWEQYYLDTGRTLSFASNDSANIYFNRMRMQDLVEDPGFKGWSGPYLSYPLNTPITDQSLDHRSGANVYMFAFKDSQWGGDSESYTAGFCEAGDNCYAWSYMFLGSNYNISIRSKIDEIVDNGDGGDLGNLRWSNNSNNIMLKIAPIKNRLD